MLLSFIKAPAILLEVMDKEASLVGLWILSLILGVGGFLLARYRHRWLFLVVAVALFLAFEQISELRDQFVGPNIVREAGQTYVTQSYFAVTIAVVLPLLGALIGRKRIFRRATQ